MKVFLVERTDEIGYDDYDSMVVICKDEESARKMVPNQTQNYGWIQSIETLTVTYIGESELTERVVLSSYNAG